MSWHLQLECRVLLVGRFEHCDVSDDIANVPLCPVTFLQYMVTYFVNDFCTVCDEESVRFLTVQRLCVHVSVFTAYSPASVK